MKDIKNNSRTWQLCLSVVHVISAMQQYRWSSQMYLSGIECYSLVFIPHADAVCQRTYGDHEECVQNYTIQNQHLNCTLCKTCQKQFSLKHGMETNLNTLAIENKIFRITGNIMDINDTSVKISTTNNGIGRRYL